MGLKLFLCLILTVVCVSVNCFSNIQQKRIILTHDQGALRHSSLNRFKRQSAAYGNQPTVVVVPNSGQPAYRGAGSSYGSPSVMVPNTYGRYGTQRTYGANNPTVVVKMTEGSSCTKKKKKKKIFD